MHPRLRLMVWRRRITGTLRRLSAWATIIAVTAGSLFCIFLLMNQLFPLRINVPYSLLVYDGDGNLTDAFLASDDKWRMHTSLEEVNPRFVQIILQKEDRWFWWHPGVNPVSVVRAAWQNLTRQKRVSGASTITMQVIRMLERRPRTPGNKVVEMFRALQLECRLSKKHILELYLNLLPYGGNIEGVKSASWLCYGQSPQALSAARMVTLAIVPNNPGNLRLFSNSPLLSNERNRWLKKFYLKGILSRSELTDALNEPADVFRRTAPQGMPHLARLLKTQNPGQAEIRTYIDPVIQSNLESLLANEINRYRLSGVTNAAAVVINNRNHTLAAYCGSAGFTEALFFGQVDGVQALRSPGSALKPFLYALAIDKGLITPRTILHDVPVNFDGYSPLNYDKTYRGALPASQALALSLNIPAVELASQMGITAFIDKLSEGKLRWIARHHKQLGLSVVLGGCGVTLFELTRIYSSLACEGVLHNVRITRNDTLSRGDTLFSAGAAWMITDILTGLKRPDLPLNIENTLQLPRIAWKTGTSYGRRDAWSIGYNPDYTVGIWVGNFDGTGIPELSGSEFAAPILMKLFNLLVKNRKQDWYRQPNDVDFRLVCSESGLPPDEFCENRVMDYYLPAVSPNRKCNHLVKVFTNEAGTVSYCRSCLPQSGYKTMYYHNLAPALIAFLEEQQLPYQKIPPHNPLCNRIFNDDNPVITSLADGKEYILRKNAGQQLQLSCNPASDASRIFWYLNDRFFKACAPSEKLFFTPGHGLVKISCSDDKGRNTDIRINVVFY